MIIYALLCLALSVHCVAIPECHKLLLKEVLSQQEPKLPGEAVVEDVGTAEQEMGQRMCRQREIQAWGGCWAS